MAINLGKYSSEELTDILAEFKVPSENYSFQTLTSGYINDSFLVLNKEKPFLILQRVNHKIFENIEGLMANISRALKRLKNRDYSQVKLIGSAAGKTYLSHKTGYWRVITYIDQSTTYNTTANTEVAFEAGRIIGKFHMLLADENLDQYVDTIAKFHNLELRKMQFLAAVARTSDEKKEIALEPISYAKKILETLSFFDEKTIPQRICHNDTKLNNILFSSASQKALCLIDLDTLMSGYFLYDFGDAVRTIVNTAAEDEQEHSKIVFEKELFEAFVDGLASNGTFLSKNEIQSLHQGVLLMPFLHGIRALTDYLNNNVYYKVSYENQNLDRCLSLFGFCKKAMKNKAFMKETIENKLTATN